MIIIFLLILFVIIVLSGILFLYYRNAKLIKPMNKSGTNIINNSGMNVTNKSGMNVTNKSGTNVTNKPGTNVTNKPGTNVTTKPGTKVIIKPISNITTTPTKETDENAIKRVCGVNLVPPCDKDHYEDYVLDPKNPNDKYNCCLLDPNRNDPSKEQVAINMTIEFSKFIASGFVLAGVGAVADRIIAKGLKKTETTVVTAVGKEVTEKVGIKAAQKVGVKASTQVAVKTSVSFGTRMLTHLAAGPVGWVLFAFDLLSMGLDLADPGGYSQVTLLDEYIKNRDKVNESYNNYLKKIGLEAPLVVGPDVKFPIKLLEDCDKKNFKFNSEIKSLFQLKKQLYLEYYCSMCNIYIPELVQKAAPNILSEKEFDDEYDNIFDKLNLYLDTPEGSKEFTDDLITRLCELTSGMIINPKSPEDNLICTYKNKEECDNSYDWNKIYYNLNHQDDHKYDGDKDMEYSEWRDNKCIVVNPILRASCIDNKTTYNYERQLCEISEEYCRMKGMDPVNTPNGLDCKIGDGQNIAEMIFGTTITRGLIQVFDPLQYKPCEPGDYDLNNIPEPIKILLLLNPVYAMIYYMLGNKLCVTPSGCPNDKELINGLCYDKCRDGFKSDGALMCYKQYDKVVETNDNGEKEYYNYENNGESHTITSLTKHSYPNTGKVASECVKSKEKSGALCYNKCKEGYTRTIQTCKMNGNSYPERKRSIVYSNSAAIDVDINGYTVGCSAKDEYGTCWSWHNCRGGGVSFFGACADEHTCKSNRKLIDGMCYEKCDKGYEFQDGKGLICRESGNCKEGEYLNATKTECIENCKPGYENILGICTPKMYTDFSDPGVPLGCPEGTTEDSAGLCYDSCRKNYSKSTLGMCMQDCPPDSTSFGAGCTRKSYPRDVGTIPFRVYLKERRIPYGTLDGPSPAESIFNLAKDGILSELGMNKPKSDKPNTGPVEKKDICTLNGYKS